MAPNSSEGIMSKDLLGHQRKQGTSEQDSKKHFLQKEKKKGEKLPLALKLDLSPLNGASSGVRWEDWHRCSRWQTTLSTDEHMFFVIILIFPLGPTYVDFKKIVTSRIGTGVPAGKQPCHMFLFSY